MITPILCLRVIIPALIETPVIAIQQSYDEILRMGKSIQKMLEWLKECLVNGDNLEDTEKQVFHREQVLDVIQKEVVEFISKLMTGTVPKNITEEARKQLRLADEYESISDYIASVLKVLLRMKNNKMNLSEQGHNEIIHLHNALTDYLDFIYHSVEERNSDILNRAMTESTTIRHKMKNSRASHLNRLASEQTSPMMSLVYMDLLNSYRRILDHGFNIAEVLSGEK